MAIQTRRGADVYFDAHKMLPGELATTTDGTRKAYVAFAPGDARELAFKDQIPIIGNVTPTELQGAVDNYLAENPVQAGATEEQAKQIELNRQNIESNKENIELNKEEIDKANANIAQIANPNLFINGNFQIWSNGESFAVQNQNTEVITPVLTADKWYAESVDSTEVLNVNKTNNGLVIYSGATQNCKIYQVLDEETYNAIKSKTLTLSYEYEQPCIAEDTSVYYETQRVVKKIVASESDTLTFAKNNAIELTVGNVGGAGITMHCVKLEVGELDTPCVPDSKDAIICKLEKQTSPQFAYMWLSTMQVIKGTHVPYDQRIVVGDAFSYSDGKLTYEADENIYVRISATVSGSASNDRCWMRIYRERDGKTATIGDAIAYGEFFSPSCTAMCQCEKDDKFYVYVSEETTIKGGGVGCYFTIEKLC